MGCEEQRGCAVWCEPSCPLRTAWLHKLLQAPLCRPVQEPKPRVLMVVLQEEGCVSCTCNFCNFSVLRFGSPCLCHFSSPLDLSAGGQAGRSKACPPAWWELGPESPCECGGPSRCLPLPDQPWGCGESWRDLSVLCTICSSPSWF